MTIGIRPIESRDRSTRSAIAVATSAVAVAFITMKHLRRGPGSTDIPPRIRPGWVETRSLIAKASGLIIDFQTYRSKEDSRFVWSSRGRSICDLADPGLCVATAHPENTSRKDLHGPYWHS